MWWVWDNFEDKNAVDFDGIIGSRACSLVRQSFRPPAFAAITFRPPT